MEGAITRKQIAGITIEIQETRIGDDIVLILAGGDKPHIGCVVQAVPRPSLTNDGSISVTSSVLNLTGHKDESYAENWQRNDAEKREELLYVLEEYILKILRKEQIHKLLEENITYFYRITKNGKQVIFLKFYSYSRCTLGSTTRERSIIWKNQRK